MSDKHLLVENFQRWSGQHPGARVNGHRSLLNSNGFRFLTVGLGVTGKRGEEAAVVEVDESLCSYMRSHHSQKEAEKR